VPDAEADVTEDATMATYYRGLRTRRPSRISVVGHELLGEVDTQWGPRMSWKLTLACGHTRLVIAGRRCDVSAYGRQRINGELFLHVPKSLNCAECTPLGWDPLSTKPITCDDVQDTIDARNMCACGHPLREHRQWSIEPEPPFEDHVSCSGACADGKPCVCTIFVRKP
jgi:hypothetical protein